jgi:hydrogenase maturation protein HypF
MQQHEHGARSGLSQRSMQMHQRRRIEVSGMVQGVGFRPFVYKLAQRLGLTGNVQNSSDGVSIEIEGRISAIDSFLAALPADAPSLARLLQITHAQIDLQQDSSFSILESSHSGHANTFIPPDIATCKECLAEMLDSANRRYRYPFINCTNCGPRFTITRSVPYDRDQTSMAAFMMCAQCQAEYDDPMDRRFHAQPNACWACGPQLALLDQQGRQQSGDALAEGIRLLRLGHILAIKGLGGFHLAVDASQPEAVRELRRRKRRGEKPFALMCAGIDGVKEVCDVSLEEAAQLESPQRPIVLLRKTTAAFDALAPDGDRLGVFLPYTPLHHLLLGRDGPSPLFPSLVMTSGNLSEEPIAIDNQEAITRLGGIADFFLVHNREILLRCDDSVVRVVGGQAQFARRSRGYVPSPVMLRDASPPILAVGGELKNTICISRGSAAFLGQHIGDLESLSAFDFFQESIAHFKDILDVNPKVIAHDLHPQYLATQWAKRQPDVRLIGVQHHHAHVAACMAENQLSGPVIGVALDGTGYGSDGAAWGGEVMIADFDRFERAAHFAYVPIPGGAQAIREPWRMAVAYLWQAFGDSWRSQIPAALLDSFPARNLKLVEQMLRGKTSLAMTSSCGRLFDAVASLTLARTQVTYEAQATIALEACCDPVASLRPYPFAIREGPCLQIHTAPLFARLTADLRAGVPPGAISRRFHDGLVEVLAQVVNDIARRTHLRQVCLSGGSFQNAHLLTGLADHLAAAGLSVYTNRHVPPGDGGLSFGQLVVAARRLQDGAVSNLGK